MRQMVRRAAAMLAVTAAMATTPAMAETEAFRAYADQLVERLAIGTGELAAAVAAGDLETAREKWVAARLGWERGETFYGEYFPEHDEAIDFWPDAEQGVHALLNANDTAPYFHDGRAADYAAVVEHFGATFDLALDNAAKRDLLAYLEAVGHGEEPFETQDLAFDLREIEIFAGTLAVSIPIATPRSSR